MSEQARAKPQLTIQLNTDHSGFDVLTPAGTTIQLPANGQGAGLLLRLLLAQLNAAAPQTVGTPAAPIQYIIDAWLLAGNTIHRPVVTSLEELGL